MTFDENLSKFIILLIYYLKYKQFIVFSNVSYSFLLLTILQNPKILDIESDKVKIKELLKSLLTSANELKENSLRYQNYQIQFQVKYWCIFVDNFKKMLLWIISITLGRDFIIVFPKLKYICCMFVKLEYLLTLIKEHQIYNIKLNYRFLKRNRVSFLLYLFVSGWNLEIGNE